MTNEGRGSRSREPLRLTFLGAAGTVTGSKYLVQVGEKKLLVDCGLFQGKKQLRLRNWEELPFHPRELSAVVLTHAHIDHTGYLPRLVQQGYSGPIYCTPATAELTSLLLPDSAHLQEEEALFANRHKTSKHNPAKPLYTTEEAEATLRLLKSIPRDKATQVIDGVTITPSCAGHILGACALSLDAGGRRITFSGDIGRYDTPILPDPAPLAIGDLLLCESTYGDRDHTADANADALGAVVRRVVERNGPLIVPAFALGRTQTLLYFLAELERAGKIPVIPVFVDSPMATDATSIYRRYNADFDAEARAIVDEGVMPFSTKRTYFCRTVEQSKALNSMHGPRIIISASGMANGGRVLHHLKRWLPEPEATVLFVGYQAEETRGRQLLNGETAVKIFGTYVPVRAQIEEISGLSAHGDRRELARWLKSCTGTPQAVRIIHGEPAPAAAFSALIRETFGWTAEPAKHLETVEI